MLKTYICKLCVEMVQEIAVPEVIVKEGLCVECYQTKAKALEGVLKRFVAARKGG